MIYITSQAYFEEQRWFNKVLADDIYKQTGYPVTVSYDVNMDGLDEDTQLQLKLDRMTSSKIIVAIINSGALDPDVVWDIYQAQGLCIPVVAIDINNKSKKDIPLGLKKACYKIIDINGNVEKSNIDTLTSVMDEFMPSMTCH